MKVREIELGDLFIASKILRMVDLKGMIKEIGIKTVTDVPDEEKETITAEKSLDVLMYLLGKVDEVEKEVLKLIGAWCGISPEDAAKLKFHELKEFAEQFVKVNGEENIASFFKQAAVLIQKKR
jgi:hypothetical protein